MGRQALRSGLRSSRNGCSDALTGPSTARCVAFAPDRLFFPLTLLSSTVKVMAAPAGPGSGGGKGLLILLVEVGELLLEVDHAELRRCIEATLEIRGHDGGGQGRGERAFGRGDGGRLVRPP